MWLGNAFLGRYYLLRMEIFFVFGIRVYLILLHVWMLWKSLIQLVGYMTTCIIQFSAPQLLSVNNQITHKY